MLEAVSDYIENIENQHNYPIDQNCLSSIKSSPFIYWISNDFRKKFGASDIKSILSPAQGAATTNNLRFLKFWWEVGDNSISQDYHSDGKKWVFYSKGGPYEKWYGNLWLVLNYENNASVLKAAGAVLRNSEFYFTKGVTYSASGAKGPSFRLLPENCVFDTGGSCIFANKKFKNTEYLLGFMNSKLVAYIVNCLNPTVNAQVGDMQRVPFVLPSKQKEEEVTSIVSVAINIKNYLAKNHIIERNSIIKTFIDRKSIRDYMSLENFLESQVVVCEAIINENIFEVYNLTEHDKAMVLTKEGKSIGGLPVSPEARDAYLADTESTKEFPLDAIREYIEALPTKEFTAEEREAIESGFGSLYQSNNDLEEFCIRHQVNPINVWYWFKQSNVIPQQRMQTLAMEFLADMIREILMKDEDGIIPLVPNAGEKVLLDRIEEKFREKGFRSAQYSSFDTVIGRPIYEYLNKFFFAELTEYLNMFRELPKTPFIWHLSSGPEQGFDCYIIIYKWSRDKLMRLRSVYIEHRERSLVNRQSDLSGNESADAQNEKDRIFRQLKEIEAFKKKIDELLTEGYNPILDDGVGKNIAPLQKKGLIPYEVLNAGQLNKYLNADW